MEFDWIVSMMKMLLLNTRNLIELWKRWKSCCSTHENWLNYAHDEIVVVKPMEFYWIAGIIKMIMLNTWYFDWIFGMMKMLLLNSWNLIELCEWWKCYC
jgi:hypothetical protein